MLRGGPRRSRASDGLAPARRASSCTSSPHFTYAASLPSALSRGPSWAAIIVPHRCERAPDSCSSATKKSSSTCAPARSVRTSAYTDRAGPSSSSAWSIRCGPRSNRTPPASAGSAASRHRSASTAGLHRSKRDSSRCSSPSEPSETSRRSVRKSPSQRRLWNTLATTPRRVRRRRSARPPRCPRPEACPPPRAARHRWRREQARRDGGWAPRPRRGRARRRAANRSSAEARTSAPG